MAFHPTPLPSRSDHFLILPKITTMKLRFFVVFISQGLGGGAEGGWPCLIRKINPFHLSPQFRKVEKSWKSKKTKGLDSIFVHFRYFRDNSRTHWRIKIIFAPLESWGQDLSFDTTLQLIRPLFNFAKNRRDEITVFCFDHISRIRGRCRGWVTFLD